MTSNGDIPNYSPNAINYQSHAPVREIVTVFWDYENCPCPMSTKLATLTYDIKRRIDHFLGKKLNKRIQLYCPMQRLHTRTRENATDLGILMMDVASKRKQESVDKRIIADIGLFALELAETKGSDIGHIVLVSGDSDYGYILARLRDKSYIGQIIIFINDYTKETLIQHADHTHCLFQSNLTRKENPFSDYNQRKIAPTSKMSSHSSHNSHSYMSHSNGPYSHLSHNSHSSHSYSPNPNSTYHNFSNNPRNFQLNNGVQSQQQWTTTYNFPYNNNTNNNNNNNNNVSTPVYTSNGHHNHNHNQNHRTTSKSESHKTQSLYHHSVNGSFTGPNSNSNSNSMKSNKRNRSHSPITRYTQNTIKILKKEKINNNNSEIKSSTKTSGNSNNGNSNGGSTYVYRRKGVKDGKNELKSPEMNGNSHAHISHISSRHNTNDENNNNNNMISAPPPIPPKPQTLTVSSNSNGSSSKSNGHRIVSQENLEEQLKQKQKEREKQKLMKNQNKNKNNSSPSPDVNSYTNSAEIDGICNKKDKNLSTFSVGSLYKINECNDEESKKNRVENNNNNCKSPKLKPNKLDFDMLNGTASKRKNSSNNNKESKLTNDFFESMITPNQDDMDKLFKDIAPKVNVLTQNNGKKLVFSPKTSHIIDLKQIRSNSSRAPKKILLKKKSKSASPKPPNGNIDTTNTNTTTASISDQIRLVWTALSYCQQNSNNTPRRREIYKAMKKIQTEYMKDKDQTFSDECINACLSYGTVEEMIKGRISSLYILPVILNALTSNDCILYKSNERDSKSHVWITLDALMTHLKSRHTNHLSTYFTLTYLYRIIRNATRLFAFHKDDKNKYKDDELNDQQLGQIKFRVRKNAYQNNNQNHHRNYNNHYNPNHYNNHNQNNNLTFNYYT